ncbi:HSPB1-associated protein 1 homolog isoform X2 [Electrophorus electricus]|uniref:HSPB1-associated protein 1 homolog isoform X2 n=1 Tax=Electrophorus electricus TaxID=8005 RepID=UPI0015D004BB|nr:HSPB1-associated protein 1 homolog isoform X2 [Electrophorus electricus]
MATKPFSPEQSQRILRSLRTPAVFLGMTDDWPASGWTLDRLARCVGEKSTCFRLGPRRREKGPLFETECSYIDATLAEFLRWTGGCRDSSVGLFANFPLSEHWAYADYKYVAVFFQEMPTMFKDVVWSDFGCPGRDGRESTLWIGTGGANTPCHMDSYGCNLVFQVQGSGGIFSPLTMLNTSTQRVYRTRSPACSVGSAWSSLIWAGSRLFDEPGPTVSLCTQARHWWHYVESIDPVTVSVNSWIEVAADDEARVGEALSKVIISALKTTPSIDNEDNWLNPTEEEVTSHDQNMRYLNLAVRACAEHQGTSAEARADPAARKRDSGGHAKGLGAQLEPSDPPPFGPHLIPVTRDADPPWKVTASDPIEAPVSKDKRSRFPHSGTKPAAEHGRGGEEQGCVSTDDVLDCLLHPDVVALVTQLMLDRQRELGADILPFCTT